MGGIAGLLWLETGRHQKELVEPNLMTPDLPVLVVSLDYARRRAGRNFFHLDLK